MAIGVRVSRMALYGSSMPLQTFTAKAAAGAEGIITARRFLTMIRGAMRCFVALLIG